MDIGLRKWAIVAASALVLSACSSTGGSFVPNLLAPRNGPTSDANGQATKESEKIIKLPARPEDIDCPQVAVGDGGATARVGGETSDSVRYQFNITDVSRECDPQGPQFALKVGVAGNLLIGPAGSPGKYSTSVRVEVKRVQDAKVLFSKSYSVPVDTAGAVRAPFNVVTEPILLPLTRARLDDDYEITVGLGAGGAPLAHPHHRGAKQTG
jgi:hypothetical protein